MILLLCIGCKTKKKYRSEKMNRKRTEAINIRLTISEIKQLQEVLQRTESSFTDLVVDRIVNYSNDEMFYKLSEVLGLEDTYRDLFYEVTVDEDLRSNILVYSEGDLIRTERGNLLVVVEVLEADNALRCYLFPYQTGDEIKTISLESNAKSFSNIYRMANDE
jgi:hypothetical protein